MNPKTRNLAAAALMLSFTLAGSAAADTSICTDTTDASIDMDGSIDPCTDYVADFVGVDAPTTLTLLGVGLAAIGLMRRKRKA